MEGSKAHRDSSYGLAKHVSEISATLSRLSLFLTQSRSCALAPSVGFSSSSRSRKQLHKSYVKVHGGLYAG